MSYRIIHYINQFYAGIGGEEKADVAPEIREGVVGPGMALKAALGTDAEIVATVVCGDSYFASNIEKATADILEMMKKYKPDAVIAGPAFNAGRYGTACGGVCEAVVKKLGIPAVSGMFPENPGVEMQAAEQSHVLSDWQQDARLPERGRQWRRTFMPGMISDGRI